MYREGSILKIHPKTFILWETIFIKYVCDYKISKLKWKIILCSFFGFMGNRCKMYTQCSYAYTTHIDIKKSACESYTTLKLYKKLALYGVRFVIACVYKSSVCALCTWCNGKFKKKAISWKIVKKCSRDAVRIPLAQTDDIYYCTHCYPREDVMCALRWI